MSSGSHYRVGYPGTKSCSPVSATHLDIRNLFISSIAAQYSSVFQWLDLKTGNQDVGPSNGHQGDMQ